MHPAQTSPRFKKLQGHKCNCRGCPAGASLTPAPPLTLPPPVPPGRLDSPAFWAALPGAPGCWEELSGPADPLLLKGRFVAPAGGADGAAGAGTEPGEVLVQLTAINMWVHNSYSGTSCSGRLKTI
jgi:hypothetical protein